jgi:hypothetical protein
LTNVTIQGISKPVAINAFIIYLAKHGSSFTVCIFFTCENLKNAGPVIPL